MTAIPGATRRPWGLFAIWLLVAVVIAVLVARARFSPELAGMLPRSDPAFAREMDFYARQGATRIIAFEARGLDTGAAAGHDQRLAAAKREALTMVEALAHDGLKPLDKVDVDGVAHAVAVIYAHLPTLTTRDLLDEIEPRLAPARLDEYVAAFKERAIHPTDSFTASAARRDLLALGGRILEPLAAGLNGAERDGLLTIHHDGEHVLVALEVPFEPGEMSHTAPLMDKVDGLTREARTRGVEIETIGPYRHFRDNLAAVYHDLNTSMPLALLLIGAVLFSLIPNLRALAAMHVPAVLGMAGGIATVSALGLDVPLPLLGFTAGMLGVAVDSGQHVVVAIRGGEGHEVRRPLVLSFMTMAIAFAVLLTSSVPGIRCIAIMVISGLGISLLAALTLLPSLTPRLPNRDRWLVLSRPLLAACQRRPARNWVITGLITAALAPGLFKLSFNENLKSYDGSRPETWRALDAFLSRWGAMTPSDFLVTQDAEVGHGLERVAAARAKLGLAPSMIERLVPGPAEQARRVAQWNDFWGRHAEAFAADLRAACAKNGLRFAAFAECVDLYRPLTAPPPAVTPAIWDGTPVNRLVDGMISQLPDGRWQVVSPLDRLTAAEAGRLRGDLAAHDGGEVWLASRGHIGQTLVAVVAHDLGTRALAIVVVVVLLVAAIERRWRAMLAELLPSGLALLWTFGLLGWFGVQLTPFAVLASAFIGGIGIDSAVFLAHSPRAETLSPVLVASITTILGMLSLLGATHPTILVMGQTLAVGMGFCLLACVLVTPALIRGPALEPAQPPPPSPAHP
jgi:predicted exporter